MCVTADDTHQGPDSSGTGGTTNTTLLFCCSAAGFDIQSLGLGRTAGQSGYALRWPASLRAAGQHQQPKNLPACCLLQSQTSCFSETQVLARLDWPLGRFLDVVYRPWTEACTGSAPFRSRKAGALCLLLQLHQMLVHNRAAPGLQVGCCSHCIACICYTHVPAALHSHGCCLCLFLAIHRPTAGGRQRACQHSCAAAAASAGSMRAW